ncbi:hypothetical protein RRSWK_01958 [Rhodopirellula sp. SWK7]|nr:hypothetical protein RRSWK_01958 [Rhodopirellula sp. SWK7]
MPNVVPGIVAAASAVVALDAMSPRTRDHFEFRVTDRMGDCNSTDSKTRHCPCCSAGESCDLIVQVARSLRGFQSQSGAARFEVAVIVTMTEHKVHLILAFKMSLSANGVLP